MQDRELLEKAANAAGIEFGPKRSTPLTPALYLGPISGWWNPLADDGDALRLAVKLGLLIDTQDEDRDGCYPCSSALQTSASWRYEKHGNDPYAATRRAITCAAAAMAERKPPNAKLTGQPRAAKGKTDEQP